MKHLAQFSVSVNTHRIKHGGNLIAQLTAAGYKRRDVWKNTVKSTEVPLVKYQFRCTTPDQKVVALQRVRFHKERVFLVRRYRSTDGNLDGTARRSRSALKITDTELKLMANAAIIGDNSHPVKGNRTPAAKGTPSAL